MTSGFGFINLQTSKDFAIKVSDEVDYEISFWFKQPTREATFELSVKTFDCSFGKELKPRDVRSGATRNVLLPGNARVTSLHDRWNFCRHIVYSKNEPLHPDSQPSTSHAKGTNLIMQPGTAKLFVNLIVVKNCLLVWDFKVKPLRTPFSTGFIDSSGLMEIWRKNNKRDLAAEQIDNIAAAKLLPYDAAVSVINI